MQREKVRNQDPFDFERGGCQYEQVFSKIGEKRAEMRRQHRHEQPERGRRSRDELTMRQVSYRYNKDSWTRQNCLLLSSWHPSHGHSLLLTEVVFTCLVCDFMFGYLVKLLCTIIWKR